ncbi:DUF6443 domain-containing protein [Flagellimonas sp. W118]|uniref:DUF6443 domain-containing protein n=1 Tax=Flagellimonas sp. W118 TaxID=3410791 RepID=UPI003BF61183
MIFALSAISLSAQYSIQVPSQVIVNNSAVYNVVPNSGASGSVSAVEWFTSSNGTVNSGFGSSASITFNSTAAGSYVRAKVTNSFGQVYWTVETSVNVINVPTPTLSAVTQPGCGETTGSFTILNYSGSYSYTITPAGAVRNGANITAPPGNYRVQASNGGATSLYSAYRLVNNPPNSPAAPILGNATDPVCGSGTGTFQIINYVNSSSYNYTFSPSASVDSSGIVSGSPGVYTVSVSIDGGCIVQSNNSATIGPAPTVPSKPSLGSVTQPNCGDSTGSFTIAGYNTSTYNYEVDSPSATISSSGLVTAPAGVYRVRRQLINGCYSDYSDARTVNNPPSSPSPPILVNATAPACGSGSGTFQITNYVNLSSYTYTPSPSATIASDGTVSGSPGVYTVSVSIDGGCTVQSTNSITIGPAPPVPSKPSLGTVNQPNCAEPNGSFTITAYDTSTYNYEVDSPSATISGSGLVTAPPGVYRVRRQLIDGCYSDYSDANTINASASAPSPPILGNVTFDDCSDTLGTLYIQNYNANYQYSFNPSINVTRVEAEVTAPEGSYTVTATYMGCVSPSAQKDVFNNSNTLEQPTVEIASQPICATGLGSITITNHIVGYDYIVSPAEGVEIVGNTITGPANSYTVTARNGNCSSPASVSISITAPGNPCAENNPVVDISGDNYVYRRAYQKDSLEMANLYNVNQNNGFDFFTSSEAVIQNIIYYDDIGRPGQEIALEQAPSVNGTKKDVVNMMKYDGYGRMAQEWLPYAALPGTFGSVKSSMETSILSYYDTSKYDNTQNPYAEKDFDDSPLNRVERQAAPGNDWAMDAGHEIEFGYDVNQTTDQVALFTVDLVESTTDGVLTFVPSLQTSGDYKVGQLYKNITKDENHDGTASNLHTTEEFTNKRGQVVLKRTYAEIGSPSVVEAHDTYYIYDDYGNLSYVLPPKMDASSATLANINTNLYELGYQYVYDYRNRLVEKKIPGKDWEYIVYNKLDLPILTQDGNQRAKDANSDEWLFTKYDAFGRVAYSGIAVGTQGATRTSIQNEVDGVSQQWVTYYDTDQNSSFTEEVNIFYDNDTYPNNSLQGRIVDLSEVLTINYYDYYDWAPQSPRSAPSSVFGQAVDSRTRGLATGSKIKVLDVTPAQWITTITRYDAKGRPIYTYSENEYLGTEDIAEILLDFIGKPLKVKSTHIRNSNTIVTLDNFKYDHMGRLLKQTQCAGDDTLGDTCEGATEVNLVLENVTVDIDSFGQESIVIEPTTTILPGSGGSGVTLAVTGNGGQEELIAHNEYDELGQLVKKKVGNTETSPLQEVDYTYNVRGWLKSINQDANADNDLFNFGISYNDPVHGATALFNGNISETEWRTANTDSSLKWYRYDFDALNRLIGARDNVGNYNLGVYDGSGNLTTPVTYDKNGNVTGLARKGHLNSGGTNFGNMDVLGYVYDSGNKVLRINDSGDDTYGFKDGTNSNDDFEYDPNGNLEVDRNKGITLIAYNHLNMPTLVDFGATGNIAMVYAADGTKLKKTASNGTVTEYANGHVYEGGILQFFPHSEGYVMPDGSGWRYVYQYLDHVDNVRLSYTEDPSNLGQPTIIEENNYYPYGGKMRGYNMGGDTSLGNDVAQRWKFGNKELDESLNGAMGTYDFGARTYDPWGIRWWNIDPLTEEMRRISPYAHAFNNPIYFMDPDGMMPIGIGNMNVGNNFDPINDFGPQHITSTVVDSTGKIIDYKDDGDDNIYLNERSAENVIGKEQKGKEYKVGGYLEMDDLFSSSLEILPKGFILQYEKEIQEFEVSPFLGGIKKKAVNYIVYFVKGSKGFKYVGITNNLARRAAEHLRARGFIIEPLLKNLTKADARAVEQALIEIYKLGGKPGQTGQLLNKINSIAKTNPKYAAAVKRGYELLKTVGIQ